MIGNIKLDEWQQKLLETKGNIVLRAGRQVGKSTAIAILAGEYAVNNLNKTIMIISATERQAFLLFSKVLDYLEEKYSKMIKTGKDKPTKERVKLKNGSVIYCLPTGLAGVGIRGYTIDLLIADEAAYIPDEVFVSVVPSIATRYSKGARIILLSTPFGKRGYFYQAFNDQTFTKFHVSSEECPRIPKDFLEQEKKRMTKLQYTQEYLGEFVDELMQFFPDSLIRSCMKRQRQKKIEGREYFLGVDLARLGEDQSTFEIGFLEGEKVIHTDSIITQRTFLSDSTRMILELDKIYNFKKIYIDDEGIGVGVYDHLMDEEQTRRKVVGLNNSKRILDPKDATKRVRLLKEHLYNNLLRLMETGKIELLEDEEVFLSLKSVQYEYTTDTLGRTHFKLFGNYTHITEGLIRLAWCVKEKSLNIWIDSF